MPKYSKTLKVRHSAIEMFDLVADVEKYPEFVPMCRRLVVQSRRAIGEGERIIAEMCVAYKIINESFTSQVTLNRSQLRVDVQYIDGPFEYLENNWRFIDFDASSCEVNFHIDYQFKSKALGLLMGGMFERVFSKMTSAFSARAHEIYGESEMK